MKQLDVLPVPAEMVPQLWNAARRVGFVKIPNYDVERTHARLLAGIDQLWVAFRETNHKQSNGQLVGVIVTSISPRPPQKRRAFERADKSQMRSLTIHFVGEHDVLNWFDSAAERIQRYARENGCRMLFLLARRGYHRFLYSRWYSKEWEVVAIGRDRPTYSKCRRLARRNTPGVFRPLIPVPADKWNRYMYTYTSKCCFKEVA